MPKKSDKKRGRVIGPIIENGSEVGYLYANPADGVVRTCYYDVETVDMNTQDFSSESNVSDEEKTARKKAALLKELKGLGASEEELAEAEL